MYRGRRAWATIKSTAAEQRALWRDIGDALLELRALWPSNQAFGVACANEGFDMDPSLRSNAMWLAENWEVVLGTPQQGLTNPGDIRKAHRDLQASKPPAPDLDLSAAPPTLNPADVLPVARNEAEHVPRQG